MEHHTHHHHHHHADASLHELKDAIARLARKIDNIMANLDQLSAAVARNNDVIESALVLIQGLKTALDAAGTDPAKLAALSADLGNEDDKLAAAVAANTPAAP